MADAKVAVAERNAPPLRLDPKPRIDSRRRIVEGKDLDSAEEAALQLLPEALVTRAGLLETVGYLADGDVLDVF